MQNTTSYRESRKEVERILGKPLPKKAVVHHNDEDPTNLKHSNLVACEDQEYHMILHQRMRALVECGHASWLKCWICKKYDAPENVTINHKHGTYHKSCAASRMMEIRKGGAK
jgi:hypothetical protein